MEKVFQLDHRKQKIEDVHLCRVEGMLQELK